MSDPRYPIGKFTFDGPPDEQQRQKLINDIEQTPAALRAAVQGLSPQQIATPYRDGGWTVRQVVHHVPESHMNAYIRFKLALTEDAPTIKPYMEDRWAELPTFSPRRWRCRCRCWTRCTTAGCACCAGCNLRTGSGPLTIPRWGPCHWKKPGPVLLARPASCGPRHRVAEEDGLVMTPNLRSDDKGLEVRMEEVKS